MPLDSHFFVCDLLDYPLTSSTAFQDHFMLSIHTILKVDNVWPYQHESSLTGIVGNFVAPLNQTIQIRIYHLYNLHSPHFPEHCLFFLSSIFNVCKDFHEDFLDLIFQSLYLFYLSYFLTSKKLLLDSDFFIVFLLCGSSVFLSYLRTLIMILFSFNFWTTFNPSFLFPFSP